MMHCMLETFLCHVFNSYWLKSDQTTTSVEWPQSRWPSIKNCPINSLVTGKHTKWPGGISIAI